mgnify:CR=1 FL=1
MKRFALFLAILLSFQSSALAARWFEYSGDTNGSLYYIDLDSLYQSTQNNIMYWLKIVHKNRRNIPGQTKMYQGKRVWYSKHLYGEDCTGGMASTPFQTVYYGLQDQILYTHTDNYVSYERPVSESIGEGMHSFICDVWNYKQKPPDVEPEKPIYLDLSRWRVVSKMEGQDVQVLIDPKTVESCSSVYGENCVTSTYGRTEGYRFWLAASNSQGLQIAAPQQAVIDCKDREFRGKKIVPQSPIETYYTLFCPANP